VNDRLVAWSLTAFPAQTGYITPQIIPRPTIFEYSKLKSPTTTDVLFNQHKFPEIIPGYVASLNTRLLGLMK